MHHSRMGESRHYEDPVAKIENGGLFNRERCRNLTTYICCEYSKLFEMYDDNKDGVL